MKTFKYITVLCLSLLFVWSCEDDTDMDYLVELNPPSNISALVTISQDNTGLVTITPLGDGVASFTIDYGDGSEVLSDISPGNYGNHNYIEGTYEATVTAKGVNGDAVETKVAVVVSFNPPSNLVATIAIDDASNYIVNVSASADSATGFEVYFGDIADEEPTPLMIDETISHTYTEEGDYEVKVVALGGGEATAEVMETVTIEAPSDPMELPITFDDPQVGYNYEDFSGTSFEVVDNSEAGSKVGAITNSGANWEGGSFNLGTPVDFSSDKTIKMMFWSDVVLPVLLKLEGGVNDERQNEVTANHGGTGWEELTFNFATDAVKSYIDGNQGVGESFVPTGQYATMTLIIDGPGTTVGTFLIDDILQDSGIPCEAETEENIDPAVGDINWTFKTNDVAHTFEGFGAIGAGIVSNPNPTGINTSCNVQSYIKTAGCETWSGVGAKFETAIDLTTAVNKQFSMKVYAKDHTTEVTLQLEFEPHPNNNPLAAVVQPMTKVGEWEELTFDFSAHSDKTFKSMIVYFDRDNACDDATYYFDNIKQIAGGATGVGTPGTGPTTFPVDFETGATGGSSEFRVFENDDNPTLEVIANNYTSVENNSANVGKFIARSTGGKWAGFETTPSTPFTLSSSNSTVKIMVYKTVISDVAVKFSVGAGAQPPIVKANTKINEWEELTFDFSGQIGTAESINIDGMAIFPDNRDGRDENIILIDNITLNASGSGGGSGGGVTTSPASGASDPTETNVISIYSDAIGYDDVAATNFNPGWDQSTTYEPVIIDSDNMLKYGNLNYQGIEFGSSVDATGKTMLHIDVWTSDLTAIDIHPVSASTGDANKMTRTLTLGEWTSMDIPVSEYTGQGGSLTDLIQFKLVGSPWNADGFGTIFVDNIYFY